MCSISDIPFVGAVVNHISEAAVGAVSRGIRYILFYKDNVAKLNSEIKRLDALEQDIERRVEQDKNNGKKIKKHVSDWQDEVKKIKGEDEVKLSEEYGEVRFLEGYKGRTSWSCFNVLRCPNPYGRFQLGRWAAKKTTTVSELSDLDKKQLTGEISYRPQKDYSPISSTEYQDFGSREVAYEKILKALNCKEDGFPVVGVYGFGGVGKTRMMEEATKEVKAKGIFNTVTRANVGQVVDVEKIQDELAKYLNIDEKNEVHRTSQLKARLSKGDTILVILDDVWSEIPFAEIGIPFGDSSIKGCKILLTSRLRDECVRNKCKDPVEIEALTEDEAWDMFTKTVGISTIESVGDSLARQVFKKCARLPLIIDAVGKALNEKDQFFWKDAHNQLMNCKPENIPGIHPDAYACLRLSFNVLHKDAYLCLLLCSLAGEDEDIPIESLFRLATGSGLLKDWNTLDDARNRVNAMVSVLKSSSLLLEVRDRVNVKLHDLIRDAARSGHDEEYKFLSESNYHSLRHKVADLSSRKLIYLDFKSDNNVSFPDDLVCPDLHTLYLKCSNLSGVQPPDSFFKSFPKLKYLFLDIKSCPDEIFFKNLCSRYDIRVGGNKKFRKHYLISEMKSVYFCNDSISGGVKSLVERGEDVTLERVTGLQKCFSQGGGAFTHLKRLDIRECMGGEYLFCTSTARCLQQLEELVISGCKMMKEIVRNEGQINEIIKFPKLRRLKLRTLPVFKSLSRKVVFPALEELIIKDLVNITEIWEEHGHLKETVLNSSNLRTLSIDGCNNLRNVFLPSVKLLEMLKIKSCEMMNEIIASVEKDSKEICVHNIEFPMLKTLILLELPKMNAFFGYGIDQQKSSQARKVSFPSLEILIIHGVKINFKQIHLDYTSKLRMVVVRY